METYCVYLSGGMGNLSFDEQYQWRKQIQNAIKFSGFNFKKNIEFFNPVNYYNFTEKRHRTEREIVEFDLNALRNSDLVIVNFNDPKSLGTCAELAIAYEMRKPVIGINESGCELHPWLVEFTTRMCDTIEESIEHVINFYLT